jgi:hypothetical protein
LNRPGYRRWKEKLSEKLGKARAEKLSAARRRDIAIRAARSRWRRRDDS